MRDSFVSKLSKLSQKNPDIFLLTADLGFKLFDPFREKFPTRFINIGIAEANMIGIAAGLSHSGKNVYCYSMVPFLTMRALEQIRVDLCAQKLNVKLVGVGGGLSYGLEGLTHHALEDIAVMRALPHMSVVCPGDPYESVKTIEASEDFNGPLYIRLGKNNDPKVHNGHEHFEIGKGILMDEGEDLTIIATGTMLKTARAVAESLQKDKISTRLISMHTIKPIDVEIIKESSKKTNLICTLEEHSLLGGLGTAVGECLLEQQSKVQLKKFGLPDEFCSYIGSTEYLINQLNLSPKDIKKEICALLPSL